MPFYSASTRAFYDPDLHPEIPTDAIEISEDLRMALVIGLNSGQIVEIVDGLPALTEAPVVVPTIENLKAYAAARRYVVETGGIAVAGISVLTDRESQRLIADAASYVSTYGVAEIDFKTTSGFVTLSAAEIAGVAEAVGAHVQASFSAEKAIDAAIDAGTISTKAEIDAWTWPANG